jgi:hypothetical protein
VLVARERARAGEVSEVGEERRSRIEGRGLTYQRTEDSVRRRIGPGSGVPGDDKTHRIGHRGALDPLDHDLVAPQRPLHDLPSCSVPPGNILRFGMTNCAPAHLLWEERHTATGAGTPPDDH